MPPSQEQQNLTQPPMASPSTPTKNHRGLLIAVSIFVIMIALATASVFAYRLHVIPMVTLGTNISSNNSTTSSTTTASTSALVSVQGSATTTVGDIIWNSPQQMTDLDLFVHGTAQDTKYGHPNDLVVQANYWKVGVINSGQYAGGMLIMVTPTSGAGWNYSIGWGSAVYYFIQQQTGGLVFLENNSDDPFYLDTSKFTADLNLTIPSLLFPDNFAYGQGDFTLQGTNTHFNGIAQEYSSPFFANYASEMKPVFSAAGIGQVYTDISGINANTVPTNGYFAIAPNGTMRIYSIEIPFYDASTSIPAITWNDGTANTKSYAPYDATADSCGEPIDFVSVQQGISMSDLVATGKTSTGDTVYEPADPNSPLLRNAYTQFYFDYSATSSLPESFVKSHPVFLWQDPLGRWIKFEDKQYEPSCPG